MTNFDNVLKLNDDETVTYLEVDPQSGEETTKELTDVPDELLEQLRLGATITLSQYYMSRSELVNPDNSLASLPRDVNKAVVYQNEETLG